MLRLTRHALRQRAAQCEYLETLKDFDRRILEASRRDPNMVEEWMLLIDERRGYVQAHQHRDFRV